ncbi:MAG: serine protease, partial [Arthrobacter sp.]|nr:serine protease [Arthrobacter sp.]
MFSQFRGHSAQSRSSSAAVRPRRHWNSAYPPTGETWRRRMLGMGAAMAMAVGGGVLAASPSLGAKAEQSYIVVLKDTVPDSGAVASAHQGKYGFTAARVYRHAVNGYAGTMTASEAQALAVDPDVEFVTM